MALSGLLAFLLWQHHRRAWAILAVAWILLVDFSRVYLGVHYPSDVLAGSILGLLRLFVVLSIRAWHNHRLKR
jgi:undecaprenyl-diphosphatase